MALYMMVSLANNFMLGVTPLVMSFTNNEKRTGPKTDPLGTPGLRILCH